MFEFANILLAHEYLSELGIFDGNEQYMTTSATSCVRSEYLALIRVILLCMTKLISVTLKMSLLRHMHILKPLVMAQMW
jgi:hypothetical protein